MKLTINLDDIYVGDWEETVATIIRDEITSTIRAEIKACVKNEKASIKAAVTAVAKAALKELRHDRMKQVAQKMAAEL